jgi:carbonic anhydrase
MPPCSEQVNWFVAERPLLISVAQYNELSHAIGFTSRYTQGTPGEMQQAGNCTNTA